MVISQLQSALKVVAAKIQKRNHKLLDYDRHRRSFKKLQDDKGKSATDERKLLKQQAVFEAAAQEYELYNQMLKSELPTLFQLRAALMEPCLLALFEMQKSFAGTMEGFVEGLGPRAEHVSGELISSQFETAFAGAATMAEELQVHLTRRGVHRMDGLSDPNPNPDDSLRTAGYITGKSPTEEEGMENKIGRNGSITARMGQAKVTQQLQDLSMTGSTQPSPQPNIVAPKKAPPQPPIKKKYLVALYDFVQQEPGDLSFQAGDRIELLNKSERVDDWWTGRVGTVTGTFPGNYVREE